MVRQQQWPNRRRGWLANRRDSGKGGSGRNGQGGQAGVHWGDERAVGGRPYQRLRHLIDKIVSTQLVGLLKLSSEGHLPMTPR